MTIHSEKLERYLGADQLERISSGMRSWHGPPIAVSGVPGWLQAMPGGDFRGTLTQGRFSKLLDAVVDRAQRFDRLLARSYRRNAGKASAGFAGASDLLFEATAGGKLRSYLFQKSGSTGVVAVTNSLWRAGAVPASGAAGSAAPGGRAPTDATAGAFPFTNPTGGDTQHFVSGFPLASVAGNTLLVYDRIFDVAKTMNSTSTEAVTGVPTRYQSTVATDQDYAGGNFLFVEVGGTALAATSHNWTVCTYTNQAGQAATLPSLTGNSGAIVDRLDHPVGQWFAPLAAGDSGIRALTQMQCSAAVATGLVNFVIGHPIAFMPCPIANMICVSDTTAPGGGFNPARIFDDACLAFLEVCKPATTATNYTGSFNTVAG